MDRVHDLDHGETGLGIEHSTPQLLVEFARLRIFDRYIVRIEHRDEPDIRRALHVVLATQRVESRARPADLAGDERQRDEAARVVGAVNVLGNAHAPEDDRGLGAREFARHDLERLGIDAADRGIFSGVRSLTLSASLSKSSVRAWTYCLSVRPSAMMTLSMALSIDTSVPGVNCSMCVACRFKAWPRGSATMSVAPRLTAFLRKVAATGWFSVGLAPMTKMTSASFAAMKGAVTAPF